MDSPCGALLTHACGPCDGLLQSAVHTVSGERLRQGDRIEVALLDPKECMKALPLGALLTHACGPCDGPMQSCFAPGVPFLSSSAEEGARCEARNRLRVQTKAVLNLHRMKALQQECKAANHDGVAKVERVNCPVQELETR